MDKPTNVFDKYVFQLLGGAAFTVLVIGTLVFHFVEKWSFLNSYYFSVVTLTTVGYGDFTPTTPFGKIFATFYILLGLGIIATFAQAIVKRRGEKIVQNVEKRRGRKES